MANIMQSGPRGLDHDRHEGRREADGFMYKSRAPDSEDLVCLGCIVGSVLSSPVSFNVFSLAPRW